MNGIAALEDGHRPSLCLLSPFKLGDCIISEGFPAGGALSPDVKPPDFTPQLTQQSFTVEPSVEKPVERIGNYLLLEKLCTASASTVVTARKAVNIVTQEEYVCKIFPLSKYQELLAPHWESGHHENIGSIVEIWAKPSPTCCSSAATRTSTLTSAGRDDCERRKRRLCSLRSCHR